MAAPVEVVGIVRDSKYVTLGEEPQPFFYLSYDQRSIGSTAPVTLLISRTDPNRNVLPAIREAMKELNPAIPLTNVITGDELVHAALWAPRTAATFVSAFGVLALLLAAVGIYGVTAYTVAQSSQEIGLRLTLGATPGGVLRMIVGQGVVRAGIGVAAGILVALAAADMLANLLYGVSPRDPLTFVAAPAVLVLIAAIACYIPARRGARLDPAITVKG